MLKQFSLLLLISIISCEPLTFSGSNVPTPHTFKLTAEDIATAESESCLTEPLSDPQQNIDYALEELKTRGIKIVNLKIPREVWKFASATRLALFLPIDFWTRPLSRQAQTLRHELIHYCQMDAHDELHGPGKWELAYAQSSQRWRVETAAYRMSIRVMIAQGSSPSAARKSVKRRTSKFPESYATYDIDPEQATAEMSRIMSSEIPNN